MDIGVVARVAGGLVALAVVLAVAGRSLLRPERRRLYRLLTRQGRVEDTTSWARRMVRAYINRLRDALQWSESSWESVQTKYGLWMAGAALVGTIALTAFGYPVYISLPIAVAATLAVTERWLVLRGRRARERMLVAFLTEAIPVASHGMTVTRDLGATFPRMAQMVRYAPLQTRLDRLVEMSRLKPFGSAADAFVAWAKDLHIIEIESFAVMTREAMRWERSDIEELWTRMAELLSKEQTYRDRIRNETRQFRSGGIVFYVLLAGGLLVAYPFARAYMSGVIQTLLWVVLAIMTFGIILIFRQSQSIDA